MTAARVLAALACLSLPAVPAARAVPVNRLVTCERMVVSPAFTADGTAFCAGLDLAAEPARLRLYVTGDHARTWREASATGVVVGNDTILSSFGISPHFASDRLLTLQLAATTYVSTDAGQSFTRVPVLGGRITTAGLNLTGSAFPHGVVVGAGGAGMPGNRLSYVFDPVVPGVRIVAGSGTGRDVAFALRPSEQGGTAGFAVAAYGETAATTAHVLHECDAALTCAARLAAFPAGQRFDQAWFAPDYVTSGTLFVTTVDVNDRTRVYVSRDRGRTVSLVPALDTALRQAYATGNRPMVVLSPGRSGSRTMFARVSVGTERRDPPAERLFRSDDDGRTWRLVAYGRSPYAPAPRGTMPYSYTYAGGSGESTPTGLLAYTPDGRLLMAGSHAGAFTVWCSRDAGRTWRPACS